MQVESRLIAYREMVDRRLAELLPDESAEPALLHAAMRYSCLAPGKRLRPSLCLAAAEAVSGNTQGASSNAERRKPSADDSTLHAAPRTLHPDHPAPNEERRALNADDSTLHPAPHTLHPQQSSLDAACALEMVHCFSLIHDDLPAIDNDSLRRGLPTCHVKFGEALALLAGDALFALSFEVLGNVASSADRVVESIRILAKATGSDGLVGGEVADVLTEGKAYDAEILELIHVRKTGALISASCEIGAILGGGDTEQVQALKRFGKEVGLAFQIVDDVLNETSTPERLGKATGSDRTRAKATYPGLYGIQRSRDVAERLLTDAQNLLTRFPGEAAGSLSALARFSVERLH